MPSSTGWAEISSRALSPRLPSREAARAHQIIETRANLGKVVLPLDLRDRDIVRAKQLARRSGPVQYHRPRSRRA